MRNIALYTNNLNNHIYEIYNKLYTKHIIEQPIIYTNKCSITTDMNIPIFYTKYIFNQHYDIIISDTVDVNKSCDKIILYNPNDTIDSILEKINKETE